MKFKSDSKNFFYWVKMIVLLEILGLIMGNLSNQVLHNIGTFLILAPMILFLSFMGAFLNIKRSAE